MSTGQLSTRIAWGLVILTLLVGVFTSVLYTELGQLLNMPSAWLYSLYPYLGLGSIIIVVIVLYILFLHFRFGFMRRRLAIAYAVLIAGMIFVTNFFVPEVWLRGHHHTAEYISISEADGLLDDDADVFVLELNGEARAYPRDWMMLPHIAGDTLGEEDVAMTYCALSNLPQAFSSSIDGQQANLKVVSQVHNNLVMVDKNTGTLYQQITASTPDNSKTLEPRAAQRMPYHAFKQLYPDGMVFHVVESGPYAWIDKITYTMFVKGLEPHYNGPDPLFPTLNLDDNRLPLKEQIWGINIGGEQVAYTQQFFAKQPIHNTTIGGEPMVVVWFPQYETVGVFSRWLNGSVIEVSDIDAYGNTKHGKLSRLPQYPHVFWMIWSHWYPQTKVMS